MSKLTDTAKRAGHSLRHRLAAAFALFALASALCFGALGVLFVYTVEDSFFANMLEQESDHQRLAWIKGGQASSQLAAPLRSVVSVHRSPSTLPPDLARVLAQGARGAEAAGDDGRHYHWRQLDLDGAGPLTLVAEVSRELVVRPRLPSILRFLGATLLVVLALTSALGYWLARRATSPLGELADLVRGAAPAQLPQGFAARFPDNEIGALAHTLEAAMVRIAGFIEREQHFTRDASHELRTPLAVIQGAAQLLAHEPMPAQAAAQLQRIRSAAGDMAHTLDTLLSLAREECTTAAPPQFTEALHLLPLVETAVVRCAHLLDGKAVEVLVDLGPNHTVSAYAPAVAILLSNLIGNAFAHTQQGTIRIYCEGATLIVADSGPGIDPALAGTLFEAGVKGAGSSGFGLGLSIARRLGERFGIGLAIDSSAHGTRALLRF